MHAKQRRNSAKDRCKAIVDVTLQRRVGVAKGTPLTLNTRNGDLIKETKTTTAITTAATTTTATTAVQNKNKISETGDTTTSEA